ncbi:chymotrypsin-C-like [Drosophila sulfurigaster albostrigata]|uniref:chymotrypsin-C-like n=1 Tax=Drosophila sulfurigaster albostrigata TaxID=89887 RepID=UPI0014718276|nr:chymotrypsin-C-like [Drosophila sulfurigaster albostrigata]
MVQLQWVVIFLTFLLYQRSTQGQTPPTERFLSARPQQFPYQVFIEQRQDCKCDPAKSCGGVIISSRSVLTSASCAGDYSVEALNLYFGAVDRTNEKEVGQQRLTVKRSNIFVHREYDPYQQLNDIALIRLPVEIRFDEFIQAAQLPDPESLYENESCIVSGWGDGSGFAISPRLHYSNVTVLSNEERKTVAHHHWTGKFYPASWICSKPHECGPHTAISGDPLVRKNDEGSNTVIGLISFNLSSKKNPIVISTRISSFLQWINRFEEINP